jgi:acetyl esterase/lipase
MNACKWACLLTPILVVLAGPAGAEEPKVDVLWSKTYVKRDTGPLDADVYMPRGDGPFPGMLVVHGGAWRIGTRAQLSSAAKKFAEHGYTAVAISYRLAPKSTFPAQIYDCQAAVRWMREHAKEFKIDTQHIGGFGYSAGGHLVALLGTLGDDDYKEEGVADDAPSARLQCVLAGGAPCDFRNLPPQSRMLAYWLAGTPADKPENYRNASPANFVTKDDPPMYFFSGEEDFLVPISSPRRMVDLLLKAGLTAELFPIRDAGHMQALFDRDALQKALAFADKNLKDGGAAKAAAEKVETRDGE